MLSTYGPVGFRERLHLAMEMVDIEKLPPKVLLVTDRFIDLVTFFFGLYLVIYGWNFAMMMRGSILSATEMPNRSADASGVNSFTPVGTLAAGVALT